MKNLLRAGAVALALFCASGGAAAQSVISILPKSWTAFPKDTVFKLRDFDSASISVDGVSGGDVITVSVSADCSTNWTPQTLISRDYSVINSVTAPGIFALPAGTCVRWSQTGSASTPAALIRAQ